MQLDAGHRKVIQLCLQNLLKPKERIEMRKLLINLILIIGLIAALAACGPKQPANHLDAIKAAGVIKVGTSADYPPFEYIDQAGNMAGFDVELMQELAKKLGVKVEWVDMPFDSLIAAVQEGKIDASIAAFNYTEERDEKIDFTVPYFTNEDAFLVTESFADTITGPEDLAKYTVGVQSGTTQDDWITENLVDTGKLPESNFFRYDRADQAALDIKNGRIQVWMADLFPAQALADKLGGLKIVYQGMISSGPMNIIIPNGDTALAEALNKAIEQLQKDGFIDQLAVKHIGGQ